MKPHRGPSACTGADRTLDPKSSGWEMGEARLGPRAGPPDPGSWMHKEEVVAPFWKVPSPASVVPCWVWRLAAPSLMGSLSAGWAVLLSSLSNPTGPDMQGLTSEGFTRPKEKKVLDLFGGQRALGESG